MVALDQGHIIGYARAFGGSEELAPMVIEHQLTGSITSTPSMPSPVDRRARPSTPTTKRVLTMITVKPGAKGDWRSALCLDYHR
jgi:hypothetical protein